MFSNKKKIALLHYAYPPNIGGVEILMREHAIILADQGYDILVLTGSGQESHTKIKLQEIKELQSILSFNPNLQDKLLKKGVIDDDFYQLADKIENLLEENLADREVIIVHNMLTIVRNLSFVYAFFRYRQRHPEKKIIVWTHDHSYIGKERIKNVDEVAWTDLEKKLLTTTCKNAIYVAISETFKNLLVQLMKLPAEKVLVIPNGLNVKKFLEIEDSIWTVVKKYNILNSFPLILSPVNILERKNLDYSLDIISYLKRDYPAIRYIISGAPSRHRKTATCLNLLKEKISDLRLEENVIFLMKLFNKALEDREIHDLYQLSDLVFYFSKSENFGLPIVESVLTKTPIFVSNLDVFHEIGGDNLFYFDYKKDKPEEVAREVREYLENNLVVKMNVLVKQKYNLETIIKEKLVPLL